MTGTTRAPSDPTLWGSSENDKRMHALPGFGWAWEYARRNRILRQSWQDSAAHFETAAIGPKALLVVRRQAHLPLDDWHCLYADDVHRDARRAAVIWDPSLFQAVVPMIACRPTSWRQRTLSILRILQGPSERLDRTGLGQEKPDTKISSRRIFDSKKSPTTRDRKLLNSIGCWVFVPFLAPTSSP